jgi:hypothetical protein
VADDASGVVLGHVSLLYAQRPCARCSRTWNRAPETLSGGPY